MMWGWWWIALPLMFLCMWMMVRMMGHGPGSHTSTSESSRDQSGSAKRILAERMARGEINIDEYERRLAALQATSDLDKT